MVTHLCPSQITLTFVHTGDILVEVKARDSGTLDYIEVAAMDRERLVQVISGWVFATFTETRPRSAYRGELTHDFDSGYTVTIAENTGHELAEFGDTAPALAVRLPRSLEPSLAAQTQP